MKILHIISNFLNINAKSMSSDECIIGNPLSVALLLPSKRSAIECGFPLSDEWYLFKLLHELSHVLPVHPMIPV